MRHEALETRRVTAVETGGCPHTAVRDDVSRNLAALSELMADVSPEQGGGLEATRPRWLL